MSLDLADPQTWASLATLTVLGIVPGTDNVIFGSITADGLHFDIPKGYLYFAVAFSIGVEALNLAAARRRATKGSLG